MMGLRNGDKDLWMVTRSYAPDEGGVQTYAHEVAHAYAALGWRVTLFAKSSAGPRRLTERKGEGEITLLDVGPGAKPLIYARLLIAMAKARRSGVRPRAIHACTWRAGLVAMLMGAPLVVTVHGREIGRPRRAAFTLMRLVLRRADRIVAVSGATRDLLLSRLPALAGKTVVAWNGTSRLTPPPPVTRKGADIAVLTFCRLVPRKNVVAATVAVAECLGAAGTGIRYRIAGRGPESPRIAQAIRDHAAAPSIVQTGYVDTADIGAMYGASDIFLHPQIALEGGGEMEGFGIAVADAMAHGLVCIVGRDGGPGELIRDGVTGLIVDGNSVDEIRDAILALVNSPDLLARLGTAAREWAARHLCWMAHCRASLNGITRTPVESMAIPAVVMEGHSV